MIATAAIICMHFLCTVCYWVTEPSSRVAIEAMAKYRDGLFVNPNPQSIILFIRTTEGKTEDETRGSVWCYVTNSHVSPFYLFICPSVIVSGWNKSGHCTHFVATFFIAYVWRRCFNWLLNVVQELNRNSVEWDLMSMSAPQSPHFQVAEDRASNSNTN